MDLGFIDFLKYGAIGISLALAILSYRLLSKEQERAEKRELEDRKLILASIGTYFKIAVFLSVFFGLLEISSRLFLDKGNKDPTSEKVAQLWSRHFEGSGFRDSTLDQQLDRISARLLSPEIKMDTLSTCQDIYKKLENCQAELKQAELAMAELKKPNQGGFYQKIDFLNAKIDSFRTAGRGRSINIKYQTESKKDIFEALASIFFALDLIKEGDNTLQGDVVNVARVQNLYCNFKNSYLPKRDQIDCKGEALYIEESDLTQMVRHKLRVNN